MADRVKELLGKVLEWWNRFSAKQKTFIICAAAGVILALAIVVSVLTRPQYIVLLNCESTKEAAEVTELLEGESLDYKVSDDGLQIKINKKQQSQASLVLGANDIQSTTYSIDNVTNGGFSTTESDKQKRYEKYLEERLANDMIARFDSVKSARVDLYIPEQTGTLIQAEQESSVWVVLELEGDDFTKDTAAGLAKALKTAVGNKTAENIVIMDTAGNMLFSGDDSYSASGSASSQLDAKAQWETRIKNEVRQVLLGTNQFDRVEVAMKLDVDFSSSRVTDHEYYVPDGNTQGYLASARTYSSTAENGTGEVPGTDSNGEVEYEYRDNDQSSSEVNEEEYKYLPGERITEKDVQPGVINYENSTISLTAISMNMVRQEDIKAQGLLDGVSWEEYKIANAGRTQIEIPDDLVDVVSKASGIPTENIAIVAYSENVFFDKEGLNVSASDVIQILLIVVILGLLAFVVLRSMRGEKGEEQPEELSVEKLLQSQPEVEIEDINTEQMSETRRMVEKFVEENPEAAANLLRNWLNEDWG